jgi:tRNA-dihydrouridine synthase A
MNTSDQMAVVILTLLLIHLAVGLVGGMSIAHHSLKFHIAPLQGYTDHHLRYLYRLMAPSAVLWTEMLKPEDLFSASSRKQHLLLTRGREINLHERWRSPRECVLQLGGNDPDALIVAAKEVLEHGYTQIDLNCGCPSAKTDANFGCSLMRDGGVLVSRLTDHLAEITEGKIPISVKCRIGIHETFDARVEDSYDSLHRFVSTVTKSGSVKDVIVHARSGILQGFSPSKNREIPPLRTVSSSGSIT